MADFDLILLTEDLDRSLAVLSVMFCIHIEDLLYVQVNQRNDFYAKERFSNESTPHGSYPIRGWAESIFLKTRLSQQCRQQRENIFMDSIGQIIFFMRLRK